MKYMKNCKILFCAYIVLVPAAAISSVLFSLGLEPLINVAIINDKAHFVKYLLFELLFAVFDLGAHYLHKICREKLRVFYVSGLKRDCFEAIMDKSIPDFYRQPGAEYISTLNKDVDKLNLNAFDSVCGFYRVTVGFLINLYAILRVNSYIVIINIVFSFISVLIPHFFEKKLIAAQNESSEKSKRYYAGLNDYLNGFATIKLFNISGIVKGKMECANQELEGANYKSVNRNYSVSCISMLCTNISYVLTIGAGVWFTLIGKMTVGQIIAVSQLMGGIAVPFEELPELISNYKSITDVKRRIFELINARREEPFGQCDAALKTIELNDVSFKFEKQESGFSNLNYTFEAGKKYIVLGESGSGKSTLAKLLSNFYICDSGEITINGKNIKDLCAAARYKYINYIEQRVFLFNDTLRNNIAMYQEYPQEEIERAVALSGLKGVVDKLPERLETLIEGNGVNFSGGELQRVAIARAILAKAQFIIFDETTANMDPALTKEIEEIIMKLQNTGIIYITHKRSEALLAASDRVLIMKDWRILEEGSYQELSDSGCLRSYF